MSIYSERRKSVLARAKGKQVVATTPANLFYLTDFYGSGIGIATPDKTIVVTSPLENDRASEVGQEVEVVKVKRWTDAPSVVAQHLGRGDVVVDYDEAFKKYRRFTKKPAVFLESRRTKDEEEIRRITRASKVLDKIFVELEREIKPGRSEWEIGAEVMRTATLNETTPSPSDATLCPVIIASGPNGALPHSELTSRKVRKGDFVVADIFFRWKGYHSDATRTFAVGKVTGEMKRNYEAVRESLESALGLIREGEVCGNVNEAAVSVLRKHRIDRYLNHSVGHGVGIDIHEQPRIAKGSDAVLRRNDVVTDEPGVYFKGRYGIRIEDTVRVDTKPVPLTRYTRDLVTVG